MKDIFTGSPDESLGYLLSRVYSLRQKKMNDELAAIGLSYVQYHLLMGLYWLLLHEKEVNQMTLIYHTKLDKSVVSNLLRKMAADKYISRKENPDDTRAKLITLTGKGEKLAQQAIEIIDRADESFWGSRPQEPVCRFLNEVLKMNS